MSAEQWRTVVGFPDYAVSDLGLVKSYKRKTPRVLSPSLNSSGYPIVSLCDGTKAHTRTVAKIVMLAFVGPRPDDMEIRHLNGVATDSRLSNLVYGTHSENVLDSVAHGTHPSSRRTECPYGHPYSEENTYQSSTGRQCRTCNLRRCRARAARRKAQRVNRIEAEKSLRAAALEIASPEEIRQWAANNGLSVSCRGFVSIRVVRAYLDARQQVAA